MYQEMEVWYPLYRLREAGVNVVVAGAKAGETYTSKLGYPVVADVSYENLKASDFDGVVIPGGFAPDIIRRYEKATAFVKELDQQASWWLPSAMAPGCCARPRAC
jgi:protease I